MGNNVIQAKIDMNIPKVPATPQQEKLLYSAKNGDADTLRDLVNRLNRHTRQSILSENYPDNITPLHRAAENGFRDACKALVSGGCDVNKMNDEGRSALYMAASNDYPDVCKYLTDEAHAITTCSITKNNDASVEITKESPLHRASEKGYFAVVKTLIAAKADINLKVNDLQLLFGDAPIHRAAKEGHTDCIKALVDAGARIDQINEDGNTALHLAAYQGKLEAVTYLTAQGSDTNAQNGRHETCRDLARRGNCKDVDLYLGSLNAATLLQFARQRKDFEKKLGMEIDEECREREIQEQRRQQQQQAAQDLATKMAQETDHVESVGTEGDGFVNDSMVGDGDGEDVLIPTDAAVETNTASSPISTVASPPPSININSNSGLSMITRGARKMSVNIGLFSNSEKNKSIKGGPLSLENSVTSPDEENIDTSPPVDIKHKGGMGSVSDKSPSSPAETISSGTLRMSGKSLSESMAQLGRKFSITGLMKSPSAKGLLKSNSVGADMERLGEGKPAENGQNLIDKAEKSGEVGGDGRATAGAGESTIEEDDPIEAIDAMMGSHVDGKKNHQPQQPQQQLLNTPSEKTPSSSKSFKGGQSGKNKDLEWGAAVKGSGGGANVSSKSENENGRSTSTEKARKSSKQGKSNSPAPKMDW